jgi:predicted glycogen debranching enzyme
MWHGSRGKYSLMTVPDPLRSEWLEADGLGGFASGTVDGIRTRRYHALLLAATTPPSGRMVLVNGLDGTLNVSGTAWPVSHQRYALGVDVPEKAPQLVDFSLEPWPRWTYALGGGQLIEECFVPRGEPTVVLRWSWLGPAAGVTLHMKPLLSGRDFHHLHQQNPAFNFAVDDRGTAQTWTPYHGVPAIHARSNGSYYHDPHWMLHFLYSEEQARGMDFLEDLVAPGEYIFDVGAGPAVLIFSTAEAPAGEGAIAEAGRLAARETERRAAFATPHLRSADAYLVRRGNGGTIIAGYPWFGDWGRDTFISLRGLCLATGRLDAARDILVAWAGFVSAGMLPNRFPDVGETPEYNSVDASLWYIIAVHEYLEMVPAAVPEAATLLDAVEAIVRGYSSGTRFGIRADEDGLLACGEPGVQLTWMDALVDGWVVTPRMGKPVEVQALWLNALAFAARRNPQWHFLFVRGLAAFHDRFWDEAKGCLYDVIDVDHQPGTVDDKVRPNQLFALGGLPLMLMEGSRAERMMDTVEQQLWTPMGPRSLAPGEPGYAPRYEGDLRTRDSEYHQGTVWPWLTGPFVEAWVRLRGDTPEAKEQARELFLGTLSQLDHAGLRHLPEIADATEPFTARGCPFQAWSLAELLRLEHKVLAAPDSPP